jgi:hypothetical protein
MDPWLDQSTNGIQGITVPSLLVPSLPSIGVHVMVEGAIVSYGVMFHKCLTPKSVTIRSYMQQK